MYKKHVSGSFFANMKQKKLNRKDEPFVKALVARMQQLRNERDYSQEYVIENTHLDISRYETGGFDSNVGFNSETLQIIQHNCQ